jgi:hypothetical protein
MASRWRTSTPWAAMRRAPADKVTLTMAGSSSGDRPTASATANSMDSIHGRPSAWLTISTYSTISTITRSSSTPNCWMPRANSVSGGASRSRCATAPKAVCSPVCTTSTVAVPLRTDVPRYTALVRRAGGVSAGSTPGCFSTGKDSPVRLASLTRKSRLSSTRPSAGTRLPAPSRTRSPRTRSCVGSVRSTPSRSTLIVSARRLRSRLTARDARYSCRKPRLQLPSTTTMMIAALSQSRSTADTAAPKTRISTSGLLNCRSSNSATPPPLSSSSVLGPSACRRRAASADDSPRGPLPSAASRAGASRVQKACCGSSRGPAASGAAAMVGGLGSGLRMAASVSRNECRPT